MSDVKLVKVGQDGGLSRRLNPQVNSLATPTGDALVSARAEMNRNDKLREDFHGATSREEAIDVVTVKMALLLDFTPEEVREAVTFLWDEYRQLGEGLFLVSPETGKVMTVLKDGDLWQPPPVLRENGSLVQPLKRIRPDLEGFIVSWYSDRAREERVLAKLATRAEGLSPDSLLPATAAGRRELVQEMARHMPQALLAGVGGTAGTFLRYFDLLLSDPEDMTGLVKLTGQANTSTMMGIQDQTTLNLQHDRSTSIRVSAVHGWVREIARLISVHAHMHLRPTPIPASSLRRPELGDTNFWVVPPQLFQQFRGITAATLFPVEGAEPMGFSAQKKVGAIIVPSEFEAGSNEMFDRWTTTTSMPFSVWVDWSALVSLGVSEVTHQSVVL